MAMHSCRITASSRIYCGKTLHFHPGGALGRKLLAKLADIMHFREALPKVKPTALVREALLEISQKGLGGDSGKPDEDDHLIWHLYWMAIYAEFLINALISIPQPSVK